MKPKQSDTVNVKTHPPDQARKFLQSFLREELAEEVQGDLEEKFYLDVKNKSLRRARWNYWFQVIHYFRPFAVKNLRTRNSNHTILISMFRHNLILALRNMMRSQSYSFITIAGLSMGITCFIFLMFWVRDEKSVDHFHNHGKNLYNVYEKVSSEGRVNGIFNAPVIYRDGKGFMPLENIRDVVPEIKDITYYATGYELPWGHPETFRVGDKIEKLKGSRAGENFFKMFSYPLIAGTPETALRDLSSIAISRKMANIFFGSPANSMGKSIHYENRLDFIVSAVFEDVCTASSLKFDFLINWKSQMTRLEWSSNAFLTTLLLDEDADVRRVESKINQFMKPFWDPVDPVKTELGLAPFRDKYLFSTFVNGQPIMGRIEYVRIFTWVAVFILIIACINFMNLATARSVNRAREVGVRKLIGSTRGGLIGQFLCESILLTVIAFFLSMIFLWLFIPFFNEFTGKPISIPFGEPSYWLTVGILLMITSVLAGGYPALFLSSLKPVWVLKGRIPVAGRTAWIRKGLTVFQFSLSIMLLIITLVISRQIDYIQKTHLGYDRENLIYIQIEGSLQGESKYRAFKEEASRLPGVAMIDRSTEAPHSMNFIVDANDGMTESNDGDAINWEGKSIAEHVPFVPASVGYDFIRIMKLEITQGRDFSRDMATDSADAFIVNEKAVREMGMNDPIGKWISAWNKKGHIIGVLKDYHTNSLHEPIRPLILDVKEYEYFGVIITRIEPGKSKQVLAGLEKVYREINPDFAFSYQFVDEEYNRLYRSEQTISGISEIFTGITMVISCLGLLGLAMFSAEQRIREIGIRKVLGASVHNIITLISTDFLQLIVCSFLLAIPAGWYLMNKWLDGYAYKITLSWWIFALAGVIGILVALLTISVQTIKSATANPVNCLHSE